MFQGVSPPFQSVAISQAKTLKDNRILNNVVLTTRRDALKHVSFN